MPLLLLIALFIAIPIAELYVIIQVGQAIGVLPTIAILLADSVIGAWLWRSQGRTAWRRFNEALAAGRVPAREVLDGALVIFGGAFLITPGFLTDIIGVILLVPPTRALVRRLTVRVFARRFVVSAVGTAGATGARAARRRRNGGDRTHDVEGTAVEVDPPHLTG
jgi:UPF0716 protein FxsA